jgi:hypothetical protein
LVQIADSTLTPCQSTQNNSPKTPYFFIQEISPLKHQPIPSLKSLRTINFHPKNCKNPPPKNLQNILAPEFIASSVCGNPAFVAKSMGWGLSASREL